MGDRFVQNRDMDAAKLESLKEDAAWQREQRRLQTEEKQRLDAMNAADRDFDANEEYKNLPFYERERKRMQILFPHMNVEQRQAARTSNEKMRQAGVRDSLVTAVTTGNVAGLDKHFKEYFGPESEVYLGKDNQFVVNIAGQGTQVIDKNAVAQLLAAGDAAEEFELLEKQTKLRETESNIAKNNAMAGYYQRGRTGGGGGGKKGLSPEERAGWTRNLAYMRQQVQEGYITPEAYATYEREAANRGVFLNDPMFYWKNMKRPPKAGDSSNNGLASLIANDPERPPIIPHSINLPQGLGDLGTDPRKVINQVVQPSDIQEFDYDEKNRKFKIRR